MKLPKMTLSKPNMPKLRAPRAVRQKVRDRAIVLLRQDIIHAGRSEEEYSLDELEYLLAEKEKDVWSGLGWQGFGAAALLLGINIGI